MKNIPDNITRQHILRIIEDLNHGIVVVPPRQRSVKYCLEFNKMHYPPKYLVRMANVRANGQELWNFYGGPEINDFCRSRGFTIVEHGRAPHSA